MAILFNNVVPTLFITRFSAYPQHLANDEPKLWATLSFYKIKTSSHQRFFLSQLSSFNHPLSFLV